MAGIFRSILNIELWRGSAPNALISGRVDANAQVVADKTGYSLTAGSYAVTTSLQRNNIAINDPATSNTATVSSVTTSKAHLRFLGSTHNQAGTYPNSMPRLTLTNATTITATAGPNAGAGTATVDWELHETP